MGRLLVVAGSFSGYIAIARARGDAVVTGIGSRGAGVSVPDRVFECEWNSTIETYA